MKNIKIINFENGTSKNRQKEEIKNFHNIGEIMEVLSEKI